MLIPITVHIAIVAEKPSTAEMNTGASNLENRSILRMFEFNSEHCVSAGLFPSREVYRLATYLVYGHHCLER